MSNHWATTLTGKAVHYLAPTPEEIDEVDVFTALSRNHRFAGFSELKIAQHILEVASSMAREVAERGGTLVEQADAFLVGLLHDFPEYLLLDVPTPFKRLLGETYAKCERLLLDAMLLKWDAVDIYARFAELMKKHDAIAVQSEAIRQRMDGWVFDTNQEYLDDKFHTEVPRRWVSADAIQPFAEVIYDEDDVVEFLSVRFAQVMILTGRSGRLPLWMQMKFRDDPEAIMHYNVPSFFADNYQVLVSA